MRRISSRILFGFGVFALFVGLIAGVANREVLSSERFAGHVDSMRQHPDVARELGLLVSDQLLQAAPELVALRPLVESVSVAAVSSPAASGVVRSATVPMHRAVVTGDADIPILRLADVGAVAVAALQTMAPDVAARLPEDMDVTLSQIGATDFDTRVVSWVRWVKIVAWMMPLLGLLALIGAGLLWERSWASVARVFGGALIWVAGLVMGTAVASTIVAALMPTDSLKGALTVAGWAEIDGRLWIYGALALVLGLVAHAAGGLRTVPDSTEDWVALREQLLRRPTSFTGLAARGGVLIVVGVFAVVSPMTLLTIIGVGIGVGLAVVGGRDLVSAGVRTAVMPRTRRELKRIGRPVVAAVVTIGIVAAGAFAAWPRGSAQILSAAGAPDSQACNGYVELCDRPYDEVSYPATHNSMSAADGKGWFIPEQETGVMGQLHDGIRVFLVDSWYGQMSNRPPRVANTEESRAEALAAAEQSYGPQVVESALRIRNSFDLEPVGPVKSYLCHELCELGATEWLPLMVQVREWMQANPREVVTFFVQDHVTPEDVETMLRNAGLYDMLYTPQPGADWATLGEMIDSGRRLVWIHENTGGGAERPWLLDAQTWTQETPFDFDNAADFTCAPNRGSTDGPLFLVNHWLNNFHARIRDAQIVNATGVLLERLETCRAVRGMIPNYVAVNNYQIGDLFASVDRMNGLD